MIETIVINYLAAELGIGVYAEIPELMPDTFIVVEKTNGGEADWIESPIVAVQSYAETKYLAAQLNENVKAAMRKLPYAADIFSCKLNTDGDFTDPTTKKYRYQAVYDITL